MLINTNIFRISAVILLLMGVVFLVFFIMTRKRHTITIISICLILVSFLGGFALHTVGPLASSARLIDLPIIVFRGVISTLSMFFGNFGNYDALIFPEYGVWKSNNAWMQFFFWMFNLTAIIGTYSVLLSMFGRRASDYFRLRLGLYNEMYIINEGGKEALILGENIANYEEPYREGTKKPKSTKRIVVFIPGEDADINNVQNKVAHFGGIALNPDKKHDLEDYLNKARVGNFFLHRFRRSKNYTIALMPGNSSAVVDIESIDEYLSKLKRTKAISSLNISVFTSSKWGYKKVEEAYDKSKIRDKRINSRFYRFNETGLIINEMIETEFMKKCLEPFSIQNDKAPKVFSLLIFGFEKVGQEILLQLAKHELIKDRDIIAHIVDQNHSDSICCFEENNEDITNSQNIKRIPHDKDFSKPCKEFYSYISNINATSFNLIVVAFADDKVNKQMANDIKMKYKDNTDNMPYIAVYDSNCSYPVSEDSKKDKMFRFGIRKDIYKMSTITIKKYEYKQV